MLTSKYYMRPVIPEDRADPESRVVIDNIPPGVTEMMLRRRLSVHGDAQIHVFVPGCQYAKGWAWVSFKEKTATQQLVQNAQSKIKENVEIAMASVSTPRYSEKVEKPQKIQPPEKKTEQIKAKPTEMIVSHPVKKNDYEEDKINNISTSYNTEDSNLDEASSDCLESRTGSCTDSGDEIKKKNKSECLNSDDDNVITNNTNKNVNIKEKNNSNNNKNNNNNEDCKIHQIEEEDEKENEDFHDDSSADESLIEEEMSD